MQQNSKVFDRLKTLISFLGIQENNNNKKLQSTLLGTFMSVITCIVVIQCIAELIFIQHDKIEEICYIFAIIGSFII